MQPNEINQPTGNESFAPPAPVSPPFYPSPYAQPYPQYVMPAPQPKNGLGTTALVLGIVGLCFTFTFFLGPVIGGPLSVLAIIFGAIGRGRARKGVATNGSAAKWGLGLGIAACSIVIVELIISIALTVAAGNAASKCGDAITNALNNPTSTSAQQAETEACS